MSSKSNLNLPAIIGGSIGGFILLSILVGTVSLILLKKRFKRKSFENENFTELVGPKQSDQNFNESGNIIHKESQTKTV